MKYNDIKFDNAVKYYEERLKGKVKRAEGRVVKAKAKQKLAQVKATQK